MNVSNTIDNVAHWSFGEPSDEFVWNIDWSKARPAIFPNLKPTTKSISLRLPQFLLNYIKMLANKKDVPYQSLIKVWLSERVTKELGGDND